MQKESTQFDFIIVGAGSSGCVLANRLSADSSNRVLLIEAGGKDWYPWIHIPVGYFKTMHNPDWDWCFVTEPDPGLNGRQLKWPRGKVLGGSSCLNGLLYVRGHPADYDEWAGQGNSGWSYDEVLPYFIRAEDQERGPNEYHGINGPLKVSDINFRRPICDAFIAAANEAGIPNTEDYNGRGQEGVSYFQVTTHNGLRWSTAKGYLKPVRKRENLKVLTNALTHKVLFDGSRAIGVEYSAGGQTFTVKASREVVLSAGAIGSPHILMHSGIGAGEELQRFDIPVLSDLKGVGKNLKDHLQIRAVYKTKDPTLNDELSSFFGRLMVGVQYIATRTGPLTIAASQVCAFAKTSSELDRPDVQFHIQPLSSDSPGEGTHKFSAFTSSVCQLNPTSAGHIELQSSSPKDYPAIHPNYLYTEHDQQIAVAGMKLSRRIAAMPSLKDKITEEFDPGDHVQTDDELLDHARNTATTIYHPVCTCKMGPDSDPQAVVDAKLRVKGVENLRIADASIMPDITSGNTNAPAIMIGEKAADMILADSR